MKKFSTNTSFETNNIDKAEDEIDLREIIFKYLIYWKWIVLSVLVFLLLGIFVYLKMDQKYNVSTSILLKEDKGSMSSGEGALGGLADLGLLSTTSNVDNEIAVLASPNLIKQVVLDLELYTSYFECGFLKDVEVYKQCPYYVKLVDINPTELPGSLEFIIKEEVDGGIVLNGQYMVKKEKIDITEKIENLPGFVTLPEKLGRLYIEKRQVKDSTNLSDSYKVYIQNAQYLAFDLAENISIGTTTKKSSVLNIGLTVLNVEKGIDFLNKVIASYNTINVQDNNEIALNTSAFIDERLKVISSELGSVENDLVNYKKEQGIADLGAEAKIFVEQTSDLEQRRISIETQIKTIEFVEVFIQQKENENKFIPNLGIIDPGLSEVIARYNTSLLSYQKLERSTSSDSPSRIKALQELNNTRESIEGAVNNVKKALNISKSEIDRQVLQLTSRVRSVPSQEMGLLEVTRQQQIKQSLYLYLMKMKEETNITMASTSDKAKVITDPIIPKDPISPKRNVILLASILLGLVIPIAIIYLRDLLKVAVSDKQELESLLKVSIIGEIIKKETDGNTIVVNPRDTSPIVELFRALRNNIQFMLGSENNKNVILVTSTIPGEGKTFVSINLAVSFTLSDKKVLLIGVDVRNPKLAIDMNFKKGAGLTSYLSGSEPNWKSLLVHLKDHPNLDILQAGAIPPNPNELLMKPEMKELLVQARADYDIIIMDSAPVGVVSDTFLLGSLADMTVYVTRENVTPKRAIDFVNTIREDNKLPNVCIVYNGAELSKNKKRYGYGHTYGYAESKKK